MDVTLFEERKNPLFNPVEFQSVFWGPPEFVKELFALFHGFASNPATQNSPATYGMTRHKQFEAGVVRVQSVIGEYGDLLLDGSLLSIEGTEALSGPIPSGVHYWMFVDCIKSLADSEQRDEWMDLIKRQIMLGSYVQTELGHGSNVRGLETTAEFDIATQEFIINTPTITATKFWPGSLGTFANHGVVFANLIVKGKNLGIHPFLVQIRDLTTHQALPGIEVGDIGPKFGYQTMDNGYLALHTVRIPRKNLLARFGRVNPDGSYFSPPNAQLRYFVMMTTRANLLHNFSNSLAKGITIAIRYSTVRGTLNYQAQQQKLFFALAATVAMKILSRKVRRDVFEARDQLESIGEEKLKLLHTLTSGLKALYSNTLLDELEICRQSCGGHGFSLFSGLPSMFTGQAPSVTYEGDNTVMLQQCGNSLLKSIRGALKGKALPEELQYLATTDIGSKCGVTQESDWQDLARIEEALAVKSTAIARGLLETIQAARKAGHTALAIANEIAQKEITELALAHCEFITFQSIKREAENQAETPIKVVLASLASLYGVTLLKRGSLVLYEVGYFHSPLAENLLDLYNARLLGQIKPFAVQIVDALGFTDNALNSALGVYNGKVYETLFDWAHRYGVSPSSGKMKEYMLSQAPKL
mmetsp:Transcript_28734/g.51136  ORF Transcript_28734/g.51136 Transcript_28734/m.51136 type:complete len:644 (-) Transcript_28734:26-1957(-)|eukprot:CAMPEP_0204907284 /NCGR_PEP_ID=MMETSP1397-20131031/6460_1 /ASSEMBLY_ACC=CAM_ASM_000891 /TAXON_ID=49980 /ORGANISM="Climacostomum Climacostomum virens, Strain Stock W-24" /LENGTH=643 /DNA_ID=CAMNT_0052076379 /DNA_START=132 /DNA_END=2063 /DNA_ORIENTATION=-